MTPRIYKAIFLLASLLLFLALAPLPYAFYVVMRGVVALSAMFIIARSIQTKKYVWIAPAVLTIGYFLPMFGVTMSRELWAPIDFLGGLVFATASFTLAKPHRVDLRKALPTWHEDYADAELQYPEEPSWFLIGVLALVALFLLWTWTSGGAADGCTNWIQDPRGGYCES